MTGDITLDDYARLLREYEPGGPGWLTGMPGIDPFHGHSGYSAVPRVRRMIAALSHAERADPALLASARLREVAEVAGVAEWEVEQLVAEFMELRSRIRHMAALKWWQRLSLVLGWGRLPG